MKKWKTASIVLCVGLLAVMLIPVFIYSCMSIPFADDFSYASNMREAIAEYGNIFTAFAVRVLAEYLIINGGMYKVFLMHAGAMSLLNGGINGERVYILCCHIAFYAVLFFFVKVVLRKLFSENAGMDSILGIYTILVFWNINNQINDELFTWALIQSAYVIPVITMMIGEILYIKYTEIPAGKRSKAVCCGFAAFSFCLVAMSPPDIMVLGYGILAVMIYIRFRESKLAVGDWIIVASTVAGSLVNVLAPGNTVRHGDGFGLWLIWRSFWVALWHTLTNIGGYLVRTPFLILCILMFVIIYRSIDKDHSEKITYEHPVLFLLFLILGIAVSNWMFSFGTSLTENNGFDGRVDWVCDIGIYFSMVIWLYYLAVYIKKRVVNVEIKDSDRLQRMLAVGAIIVSLMVIGTVGKENFTTTYMISSLLDGSSAEYVRYQESIIDEVQAGEDDVYITYDCTQCLKRNPIVVGLRLCDNPDDTGLFWKNKAMARYYGKNQVFIEYYWGE